MKSSRIASQEQITARLYLHIYCTDLFKHWDSHQDLRPRRFLFLQEDKKEMQPSWMIWIRVRESPLFSYVIKKRDSAPWLTSSECSQSVCTYRWERRYVGRKW